MVCCGLEYEVWGSMCGEMKLERFVMLHFIPKGVEAPGGLEAEQRYPAGGDARDGQ